MFFIPEMLAFQQIPAGAPPLPRARHACRQLIFWTVFREPLDVFTLLCAPLALHWFKRDSRPPGSHDSDSSARLRCRRESRGSELEGGEKS